MPCSTSSRSLAALQRSGSPTNSGTICVGLTITGSAAAVSTALVRAARSWWRSRSHCEVFRWRMAAVAAAQTAGGSAVVKMNPGAYDRTVSIRVLEAAEATERLGKRALDHVDAAH